MKRSYTKRKGFNASEVQPLEETVFNKAAAKTQLKNFRSAGYRNLHLRSKKKGFQIFGSI